MKKNVFTFFGSCCVFSLVLFLLLFSYFFSDSIKEEQNENRKAHWIMFVFACFTWCCSFFFLIPNEILFNNQNSINRGSSSYNEKKNVQRKRNQKVPTDLYTRREFMCLYMYDNNTTTTKISLTVNQINFIVCEKLMYKFLALVMHSKDSKRFRFLFASSVLSFDVWVCSIWFYLFAFAVVFLLSVFCMSFAFNKW